ncbi:energy-coupling factor ABC transporter permease [Actinospongicola halichondriae]|uniref:energy-coupling factor ABC transporter permease n=1 Tax=Actinospongicola halichondriae TaxID=3236844 RepID=UPI003D468F55
MHVPDGFFDATTSVGAGVFSAGTIAVGLRKAADDLSDRLAPMAGLVAAFIFALQLINFPVASGTSGHLIGGALAAVLVGPWVAIVCLSIVLFVQALLFADGGLSAYGINVILMAIVPVVIGYGAFVLARTLLPKAKSGVVASSAIGAALSVPVAAATFALLFGIGGTIDLDFRSVLVAMVGTHVLIGIGEAAITAAVVSAVVGTRPDLVHGATALVTRLDLRTSPAAEPDVAA